MPGQLDGIQVVIITGNTGVEHDELVVPRDRLRERGARVVHAAVKSEPVQTYRHDLEPAETIDPDTTLDGLDTAEIDVLVIPGGTVNADRLRTDPHACALVRALTTTGVPIAAICHGPWLLVDAGVIPGKTLTSYPSLRTDIANAGGWWVDDAAVRSDENNWPLITSRNPSDLPAFVDAITEAATGSG
ncbi:DJ-1/PfpI/YhbO family deglycase/protease [Nocardia sp. ET3-3]|uniref:DJ-1/PfpI/YhbO family deglycase/protease n=1 Tax=Nocardia terrae TaxID=2675851 RepID=A0A7K1UW60_9NOCA|nr:type 1 glutamine amidotransferase domain-containing protein [Nocardia terrae]MVU78098.1 DJ-1/PfpI/YhbO family deglycase/protease [Nocardia terrae]